MIKYTLRCPDDHRFDSWFASADAFETLLSGGHLSCAVCGAGKVEKAMMAPRVRPGRKAAVPVPADVQAPANPPKAPPSPSDAEIEAKLAALRRKIEESSDYVGRAFAKEARAIHDGEAPGRPIYGEASGAEVKDLIEDGVPVAPLPFAPTRKLN